MNKDKDAKPKICPVCKGARFMQNDVTKEVRPCWECNAGGKIDKTLIPGRRWA